MVSALALGQGCAMAGPAAEPPSPADSLLARTHLSAILMDHWAYVHQEWPTVGAWAGVRPERLPTASWEGAKARGHFARAALRALDGVRYEALPETEYLSWSTLLWDMEMLSRLAGYFSTDFSDLAPRRSPLGVTVDLLAGLPLTGEADAQRYLELVHAIPLLTDSLRAGLVLRRERGVILSRALVPRAARFARSLLKPAMESPFSPSATRLAALDTAVSARFVAALTEAIEQLVNPALARLADHLEGEYQATAPALLGLGQYPGGLPHYVALLEFETTLDITPEDAHRIGLQEVLRLDTLVAQARAAAGAPVARDALLAWLRGTLAGSPHATMVPESLPSWIAARRDAAAATLLPALADPPRSVVEIDSVGAQSAEWEGLARYTPPSVALPIALYRINPERIRAGAWYPIAGHVLQDLIPGRHLQAARQRENGALPAFRRVAHHGGFVEGWSVYALELADSVGSLTPAERLGARLVALRAACGLVVDTGINYFGWSAERALDFLRQHLPGDDAALMRELVIPVAEEPASLTAAALGARELRALRHWAGQELGERFDPRAFHEAVLSAGSLPLPVLGAHIEWWIHEQQAMGTPR
ncbi:MAG TPA: DUF885 domain-containing protein [Gemmatimonadaceae bacterium]|nr:DUF885 domain-containing protein [Gemmatimonadaceae bacterium]